MRTAAIGIGSNSLRMLIANIGESGLQRLGRYREGLRVFAALDDEGKISQEMLVQAADSIETLAKEAVKKQVDTIHLFATSAVRDASNADELERVLFDRTGLKLEVCSGDEEAELSFLGATSGIPSGMIDIARQEDPEGAYDVADMITYRPEENPKDAEYAWYDICTWTPREDGKEYFWIGPGRFGKDGKSSVKAVYLDKIELSPAN